MRDRGGVNLYKSYEKWKKWDNLFAFDNEDALYFSGELKFFDLRDANFLEIGFGSGSLISWARSKGANVWGTEINDTLAEAARAENISVLNPNIEDIYKSFQNNFDIVVAFDVFEHFTLDEIIVRLSAIWTMLKPGGVLMLRFPNAQSPFGLAAQNGDPTHKTALSRSIFEHLCQNNQFEIFHYGPSYRIGGSGVAKKLTRVLRGFSRDVISFILNKIYSSNIPWDPVVVLGMRKPSSPE